MGIKFNGQIDKNPIMKEMESLNMNLLLLLNQVNVKNSQIAERIV